MPHQIIDKIKRQRSQKMLALAEESAHKFHQRFLGKTIPVLWEKESDGTWSGFTANYIKVYTESSEDLTNKLVPVKLVEISKDVVRGTIQ